MDPITPRWLRPVLALVLAMLACACARRDGEGNSGNANGNAAPADLPELSITVFSAPSQSIWLPTLIQELKLDRKQGFRLKVTPKPGSIAYTDFATGNDPVCYCANPSGVARFVEQGSDITLLWNIFNLDYFVITKRDDIRTVQDLRGREFGADTSSGTWVVASWLLEQQGVELDQLKLRSTSNYSAAIAELTVGRLDAMLGGLVHVATIQTGPDGDSYRALDLNEGGIWERHGGGTGIPSIAFGVWRPWLREGNHAELARKLYRANLEAADYLRTHPQEAARIISAKTSMGEAALLKLFKERPQMIDIHPISQSRDAIRLLTQQLLPQAGALERPLTDAEVDAYVSDFRP